MQESYNAQTTVDKNLKKKHFVVYNSVTLWPWNRVKYDWYKLVHLAEQIWRQIPNQRRKWRFEPQDTYFIIPRHIQLPVCLSIIDPYGRAPKKNTSHGYEVLPQDTTHRIQRPCYQRGSPCQDPAGNRTTRRHLDDRKETQTAVVWSCHQVWQKPSCKAQWKGEEDKADRGRGGKTTLGNGQAWGQWSSLSPREQWRTEENGGNWSW